MKIYFFFFLILFSSFSFAEAVICIDGGDGSCPVCTYDSQTGSTSCGDTDSPTNSTGSVAGVWDSVTHTCSNGVAPVANNLGELTCPANSSQNSSITVPTSTVNPNPSKDDVACDPSKTGTSGDCAAQKTLQTTNALISESNSKLGSIATTNAINSNLLSQISQGISNLSLNSSTGSGGSTGSGSGTNTDSSGGTDTGTGSGDSGSGDAETSLPTTTVLNLPAFHSKISAPGSCPPDISFNVLGHSYSISYSPLCNLAQEIRPVVIAVGIFSALLIISTAL
ncbi:MAG: virulence factor TspB C-terminal domain-related protein [Methylococcaceae bacterium]